MSLATAAAIRDRIHSLIEDLSPVTLSGDKFRRWRNEGAGDFADAMEKIPSSCLRRFQARQVLTDEPPLVSDTINELVRLRIDLSIAYPQTGRFGPDNALDRDDVIQQDRRAINQAVGLYGRGNFSATHDCTPLPATSEMVRGDAVDFLVFKLEYEFFRSVIPVYSWDSGFSSGFGG